MRKPTGNLFYRSLILGLLILPVDVRAEMAFSNTEAVAFSSSGIIHGASHSIGLSITKDGLRQNEAAKQSRDLWVVSQQFKFGSGIGSPQSVYLLLTLNGNFANTTFPRACFFRYSADGRHWTSWQAFVEDEPDGRGIDHASRRFRGLAEMSQTQSAKFEAYRQAWKKRPESKGSDNEQKIAAWIVKQDPKFFESYIPFIGFVQVRIEGKYWPNDRVILNEALLRMDWAFSGFRKVFR